MKIKIHHRDTESTEDAQRVELLPAVLCAPLCVLCASVVSVAFNTFS
jgi:hypothetical protein